MRGPAQLRNGVPPPPACGWVGAVTPKVTWSPCWCAWVRTYFHPHPQSVLGLEKLADAKAVPPRRPVDREKGVTLLSTRWMGRGWEAQHPAVSRELNATRYTDRRLGALCFGPECYVFYRILRSTQGLKSLDHPQFSIKQGRTPLLKSP